MKIGKEARNGLISAGVGGLGALGALLLTPWLWIPGGLGLIGVGYFGNEWRIHRKGGQKK